ncbi:dynein light chain roadblock-type 1 isoform 1-T1 [Erethizon dorsatum]
MMKLSLERGEAIHCVQEDRGRGSPGMPTLQPMLLASVRASRCAWSGGTADRLALRPSGMPQSCIPIKSTMDSSSTTQYANLMHSFVLKARSTVREIDPQNDLTFLRIRSKKNEIMVAPDKDYFLIVIQNPTE